MSAVATSSVVTPKQAALVLTMAVILFGCNWPVLKIAMRSISPLWFTTLRMAGASVLCFLFLAARGNLVWPSKRDLPMVASLGLCQYGMMSAMIMYGVSIVGAGRVAMLVYTSSIWVTLGAIVALGERPSRAQIVGMVCGIAGLAVLFSPFGLDWHDRRVLIGNGSVIAGSIIWSIGLLHVRGHLWHADPIQLMPMQTLVGAVVALPFAMVFEGPLPTIHWSGEFIVAYLSVVVLATCIAFWGLVVAGRALPPVAVSLGQLATPVLGVVCSALVVAETPSWADIAGLLLILSGVAFAAIFGRRRPAGPPIQVARRAAE